MVVRLGEIRQDQALEAVTRHFGQVETVHVDRRDVWALARARGAAAALVAPDLQGGRLRLTSMLLAFARPRERWRIDLHGRTERWSLGAHLARNAWPLARHLVACGIAAAIGQPILRVMAALIKERRVDLARPERILYLRSQLWLGLAGGGSVAHTAGVIGGLQECGRHQRSGLQALDPGAEGGRAARAGRLSSGMRRCMRNFASCGFMA